MGLTEIFTKAILNTILGMGTVFSVLIFISFIISLLKYLPGLLERFHSKKFNHISSETSEEEILSDEPSSDDGTILAAVITGALVASISSVGANPDDYIVRTIRRK